MKVCPRCNYVDTEGRRVCLACRGSLMGVVAVEPEVLLASVGAGAAETTAERGHVPWGPGLRALLDEAGVTPVAEDPATPVAAPAPSAAGADASPDPASTREQLARMYDARTAAPVVAPAVAPAASVAATAGPTTARRTARVRATPAQDARDAREATMTTRRRRRIVVAVVMAVVAVLGVRQLRDALHGDDAALARDPTTAVDRLPWRTEAYGDLSVSVPTTPEQSEVDAASGFGRYDRYVLPDITLTITSRGPVAGLDTDAALRSYASQAAQLAGGAVTSGFARDLTFGTAFSATLQTSEGTGYLYVVSTSSEVLTIRADAASVASGRPTSIFERVIRSVTPR